ncbi:uncharacterized protein LOC144122977 [Amblyomma americanum]
MARRVLGSVRDRIASWSMWMRQGGAPVTTTSTSEHIDDVPDVVTPCLAPGNQLTGPPFVFSTKYFQTIAGALNLTETCLSTVLFNSLCSRSEESLSAVLFTFSFAYSIAGLYMLLNGVCNSPLPSGDTSPGHRSGLMVVQQLIFHCVGTLVFLACGVYVLVKYFRASQATAPAAVSLTVAGVHLLHTLYVYRGDFQRLLDSC